MSGPQDSNSDNFADVSRPITIGVTGGSGSGKTYLVESVRQRLGPSVVAVITQDNYYRPIHEQQKDEEGVENFDMPSAFFIEEFRADIKKLQSGVRVERAEYVFNNRSAVPGLVTIDPAPVILVEGLFILHDEALLNLLDISVFMEVHYEVKLERRIDRDQRERNYPPEDVRYRFENHVLPAYETFILPHRSRADLIINNNRNINSAIDILSAYISTLLV